MAGDFNINPNFKMGNFENSIQDFNKVFSSSLNQTNKAFENNGVLQIVDHNEDEVGKIYSAGTAIINTGKLTIGENEEECFLNINNMLIFYKELEHMHVSKQKGGYYEKDIQKTHSCFCCFIACTFQRIYDIGRRYSRNKRQLVCSWYS